MNRPQEETEPARKGETASIERPVVLCPLEFERRALERAGLGHRARLVCCGPGREGVVRWAEREGPETRFVILAGLAGSLREAIEPGDAFVISTVMSARRTQRRASLPMLDRLPPTDRPRRAMVASADVVLTSPEEKRAWAERTGADLVDLESDIFAEAAALFGWRWLIVRGVSDGVEHSLPPDLARWVDSTSGRPRFGRILISLLRRPRHVMSMIRLGRDGRRAMQNVARLVVQLLDAAERTVDAPAPLPVLIFGGTFDPPHRAHIEIPQRIAEHLGCERIIYIPTSLNPLKDDAPTPPEHRLAMLRLALRNRPDAEIDTGELFASGPSYTVDTLERLRAELGATKPEDLRLLMGSDAALSFDRWRDSHRILELAQPVVMLRGDLEREAFVKRMRQAMGDPAEKWNAWVVDLTRLDVSGTDLREAFGRGDEIPEHLLDPAVEQYIRDHNLYRK